ncbi:hypothetical protein [Streptomyces sp. URMC 124]|uniref:hypothetical protein n=1 Tax=Streptomyces sp. URMC 124 TaxID=3423405 RepID=UPI003F1A98BD
MRGAAAAAAGIAEGTGGGLLAGAGPARAAGPAGMLAYRYLRDALVGPLRPTGEVIFPCIRGVYDKISGARSRYYLYYAA